MPQSPTIIQNLPIPIIGLAFGICTLGWNIELFYALGGYLQVTTSIIAALMISLVSLKLILSNNSLWQSQSDPAIGPILSTIPMTMMVISTNFTLDIASYLWGAGLFIHALILASFMISRALHFNLAQVSPAWFIPTIGLAIAPVTNPHENQLLLNQLILLFCSCAYFLLLPLVAYRLIKLGALPPPNRPAMALFAAPPNLCLVGYLALIPNPSMDYLYALIGLAMVMTLFSYYNIFKQAANSFFPSIGAFTFPLVIGAAAMRNCAAFFELQLGYTGQIISFFNTLAVFQICVAASVTLFVCWRYLSHFYIAPTPAVSAQK